MKILIIGGGAVSESTHIPAAIKVVGVENVFLAEPNIAQSQKIAEKFTLQNCVADYKDVLTFIREEFSKNNSICIVLSSENIYLDDNKIFLNND